MPADAQKEQKEFIVTVVQAVGHLLWLTMCRINFFKERERVGEMQQFLETNKKSCNKKHVNYTHLFVPARLHGPTLYPRF